MGIISELNDVGKLIKNLRKAAYADETNEILDKLIDVKEQIVDLQSKILELKEENAKLRNNNRIETDYERINVGKGTVLVHKDKLEHFKDPNYVFTPKAQCFCQFCAQNKKLIVMSKDTTGGGFTLWCDECRKEVNIQKHPQTTPVDW